MNEVEIKHQLDLVVRLLDTTNGRTISGRGVSFKVGDAMVPFIHKGGGVYILVDSQREDACYDIHVDGYEDARISVEYGESEKRIQSKEVSLVPKEKSNAFFQVVTMSGQLEGLEEISAIRLSRFDRTLTEFDSRRCIVNYYGGSEVSEKEYAILNKNELTFEIFQVKKAINATSVSIMEPLRMPHEVRSPIVRIVKGIVSPDHKYLLRIRDDGQGYMYLVRYKVNGSTYFKKVDFRNEEERSLS